MAKEPTGRLHKATYARDKRNPGGYLIRVIGPTAGAFEGREVPVTRKDDTESMEKLLAPVWVGTNDDPENPNDKRPVALYRFEAKPREEAEEIDLPF